MFTADCALRDGNKAETGHEEDTNDAGLTLVPEQRNV